MHPAHAELPVTQTEYLEPTSLEAAEEARRLLIDEIANITQQLGEKERRHPDGKRWTEEEYKTWRRKATTALRARESVLRRVNAWLQTEKRKFHAQHKALNKSGPTERVFLLAAHQLLIKLDTDDVEFDAEELELIKSIGDHLHA